MGFCQAAAEEATALTTGRWLRHYIWHGHSTVTIGVRAIVQDGFEEEQAGEAVPKREEGAEDGAKPA